MNAPHATLQDDLASAVELECNVLSFVHDNHDAASDRREMEHLTIIRQERQKKRDIKEKHRRTRYALLDQITELQRKLAEVDAGAELELAAADAEIARNKAYLAAGA